MPEQESRTGTTPGRTNGEHTDEAPHSARGREDDSRATPGPTFEVPFATPLRQLAAISALAFGAIVVLGWINLAGYLFAYGIPWHLIKPDPLAIAPNVPLVLIPAILALTWWMSGRSYLDVGDYAFPSKRVYRAILILQIVAVFPLLLSEQMFEWAVSLATAVVLAVVLGWPDELGRNRWRAALLIIVVPLFAAVAGYARGYEQDSRREHASPVTVLTDQPIYGLPAARREDQQWRYESVYLIHSDADTLFLGNRSQKGVWYLPRERVTQLVINAAPRAASPSPNPSN